MTGIFILSYVADILNERTRTAIIYKQRNMQRAFKSIAALSYIVEIYTVACEKKDRVVQIFG